MTRVWIAFGLIGVILTLSFTEYHLCKDTSDKLLEIVGQLETTDDPTAIKEYCDKMKNIWNSRKAALEVFLYHSDADSIESSLEMIKRLAKINNTDTIYTECGQLRNKLTAMEEAENVCPHNIL